jgi:hypothetical protein
VVEIVVKLGLQSYQPNCSYEKSPKFSLSLSPFFIRFTSPGMASDLEQLLSLSPYSAFTETWGTMGGENARTGAKYLFFILLRSG